MLVAQISTAFSIRPTHVDASSQFLLCNFLLSPAESAWSQIIK
jgi:hypothetical protein